MWLLLIISSQIGRLWDSEKGDTMFRAVDAGLWPRHRRLQAEAQHHTVSVPRGHHAHVRMKAGTPLYPSKNMTM